MTFESVDLLAVMIVIRTFLSFSLETEIEGRWPWRRVATVTRHGKRGAGEDPQPAAAAFAGWRSAIATAAIIVVAACMAPAPSRQSLDAAVIRSLDGYAALLAERGRLSQAAEVSTQAEKMREGERARAKGATSYYLGFQPDRTLDQYAAELRRLGQDAPAADAARLAVQYREAQIRAVDALAKGRASP